MQAASKPNTGRLDRSWLVSCSHCMQTLTFRCECAGRLLSLREAGSARVQELLQQLDETPTSSRCTPSTLSLASEIVLRWTCTGCPR